LPEKVLVPEAIAPITATPEGLVGITFTVNVAVIICPPLTVVPIGGDKSVCT
jgi:hypothetical protein